jgi:carboxypeptidase C (cathepsin A)
MAWFGGGPGAASTRSTTTTGPCHFRDGTDEPVHNEHSFTEVANLIYIDQLGTGYTAGSDDSVKFADSSKKSGPIIWKFLQALYKEKPFAKYIGRDTGIFTGSYGGHYGPDIASYILDQNDKGEGEEINLKWLLIDGGEVDQRIQTRAQIDYSEAKGLIPKQAAKELRQIFDHQCVPAMQRCDKTGTNQDCKNAEGICWEMVGDKIWSFDRTKFNVYNADDSDKFIDKTPRAKLWFERDEIKRKVGAKTDFVNLSRQIFKNFIETGDGE